MELDYDDGGHGNMKTKEDRSWRFTKKSWSMEEDQKLVELVNYHGTKNWSIIAQLLPNRIGKQCRERWYNHLDPHIKKGDWTEEEDDIIVTQQLIHGNQWSLITKMLPGRTDNSVKNRWHATSRARQRAESLGGCDAPPISTLLVDKAIPVFDTASPQVASAYYSDSELYLDAECLIPTSISNMNKAPSHSQPKLFSSNISTAPTSTGVGWLVFPKDGEESSSDENSDSLIKEWAQTLRSSSVEICTTSNKSSSVLLPRSFEVTADHVNIADTSTKENIALSDRTQSFTMPCLSPNKVVHFADIYKYSEIDLPPRDIFSPDIMADQYAMELEGLPHAMELCLSPPLDRITFCSPDTMTMRGIQFEYSG